MKARTSTRPSSDDGQSSHVVDDLARDCPVTPAELDAVEAFLMPIVHALFADRTDKVQGSSLKQGKPAD
jgi:hypothetical protein